MIVSLFRTWGEEDRYTPSHQEASKVLRSFISQRKHRATIENIRSNPDKKERHKLKNKLPVVTFCGKFSDTSKGGFISHSGLMVLDFDEGKDLPALRKRMQNWNCTYACFESPSGGGKFKALIRVEEYPTEEEYKQVFKFFEQNYHQDKSGSNINRLCYVSYDPNLYLNENAKVFTREMLKKYSRPEVKKPAEVKILGQLSKMMSSAPSGERQHTACVCGYIAGGYISSGQLDEEKAIFALDMAAEQRGGEVDQSKRAIRDGISAGKEKPLFDINEISQRIKGMSFRPKVDPTSFIVKKEDIDKEALEYYQGDNNYSYSTGIKDLDYYLSIRRNSFDFMVGGSKAGKTTIKLYINTFLALKHGLKTLALCFENDSMEVQDMVIGFLTKNDPKWVFKNNRNLYNKAKDFFHEHFSMINLPPDYGFLELIDVVGQINSQSDYFQLWIDPIFKLPGTEDYAGNKEIARHAEPFANEVMSLFVSMHPVGRAQKEGGHVKDLDAEFGSMYGNAADMTFAISRDFRDADPKIRNTVCMSVDRVRSKKLKGGMETVKDCPIKFEYQWKEHNYDIWVPLPDNPETYVQYKGGLMKEETKLLL